MKITFYGHSCFAVEIAGKVLLFDPFIKHNPLASHIDIDKIKCDYILVSHGHQDHIADAPHIAHKNNATIISNYEIIQWLKKQGVAKTHDMNIGGHWMFDFGKVKCVNAVHSSSMPDGTYGGNPMGFLIESSEGNFYYSGDTALTYDMKLIGDYKNIDVAFLPIGNNFTMGVDNAIIACNFIKCNTVIGLHYDSFPPIVIDKEQAKIKFSNAGKQLILIPVGDTIELNKKL